MNMRIHLPRSLLILAAFLFSLWPLSCRDPQTATTSPHVAQPPAVGAPQDPADYGTVAKAIARTMRQPGMRRVVLAAMGRSPYERGAMPLPEVLASHPEFAASVSAHLSADDDGDRLRAAVVRPDADYVLVIPSTYDRGTWRGTDDVVVVGAPRAWASGVDSVTGYDIRGASVNVRVRMAMPFPIVLVTDGAADLLRSPQPLSSDEHFGPIRFLDFTWSDCSSPDSAQDLDADGILDSCEFKLADTFRPRMRVSPRDDISREEYWEIAELEVYRCGADRVPHPAPCPSWAGPQSTDTLVTAFFGFAYHDDHGYGGLGGAHPGDSEFIVVYLHNDTRPRWSKYWSVEWAFFSAHWSTFWDSSSLRSGSELEWMGPTMKKRFATRVLQWKHANYPSRARCDNSDAVLDRLYCKFSTDITDFRVVDTAKFALRWGRTYSREGQPGHEIFWHKRYNFCGWQDIGSNDRNDDCSSTYWKSLWHFGFRPHIPPGDPPDPVEITSFIGPTRVRPDDANCAWTVFTSGGRPPIWLRWWGIMRGTAYTDGEPYDITGNVSTSGWLHVDAGGGQDQDSIEVSVSNDAPRCFGGQG